MNLRVTFPDDGRFVNDPRTIVTVGDTTVYDGSMRGGFTAEAEVPSGTQILRTSIHVIGEVIAREKDHIIEVPSAPGDVVNVELHYRREWGNFSGKVQSWVTQEQPV